MPNNFRSIPLESETRNRLISVRGKLQKLRNVGRGTEGGRQGATSPLNRREERTKASSPINLNQAMRRDGEAVWSSGEISQCESDPKCQLENLTLVDRPVSKSYLQRLYQRTSM